MPTILDKTLKRAVYIEGNPYVLTLSPQGFTLVPKGRRKGHQIFWRDFVSGEVALATALNASLQLDAENEGKGQKKPSAKTAVGPEQRSPAAKTGGKKAPSRKR